MGLPIHITKAPGSYRIRVGDHVIGQTDQALLLDEAGNRPVIYVPRDAIIPAALEPTSRNSTCPYKGEASYFSVLTPGLAPGGKLDNVVWSYATPKASVAAIAGYLAFYPAVTVEKV